MELRPSLFCLFFCLLYFFLPPFEELGCFSGCLMSSAGIQKLFCGIYSTFRCSFDEFVGEKMFSPSYSSAILAPPLDITFLLRSKHLLISWLKSPSDIILVKIKINLEGLRIPKDQEEPRWRRSRTGRTLSPPQIHQKSI